MVNALYDIWKQKATADADLISELEGIANDKEAINDRFYRSLDFGTAGLRGVIGAGTNRMNVYTVGKATQGLAQYVKAVSDTPRVAIGYDSRIKSDVFARHAASILAANGVKVMLYPELVPTPMVSFAVRHLKCDAGIVITASHNPAIYNGYKAYGPDGCQLGTEESRRVMEYIEKIDTFSGVLTTDFDAAVANGSIEYIGEDTVSAYLDNVQSQMIDKSFDGSKLSIIYTPLNGAGNKPVRKILDRIGVKNVFVVPEQEQPDGNFPTTPFPNPEIRQVFECGLKYAEKIGPDLLMATDPDSDRIGLAVKHNGEYTLTSGNEVGILLLNYILRRLSEQGSLPENPVAVKTIVATPLGDKIAAKYGCNLVSVLTGFKYIGEQIAILEKQNQPERFVLGFEDSYGYLRGSYVRDKDAVVAAMLICEMAGWYKAQNKTLLDGLNEIYEEFGYCLCEQRSQNFEGQSGMQKMADITASLRACPPSDIGGLRVEKIRDYKTSTVTDIASGKVEKLTLPSSDVLAYELCGGSSFVIRPSGTEPKIKAYIFCQGKTNADCLAARDAIDGAIGKIFA